MQFRGTASKEERREIVNQYEGIIIKLIDSGQWNHVPPPEDQLPDDCMPRTFFEYWANQAQ